jgi:hypothetical protein
MQVVVLQTSLWMVQCHVSVNNCCNEQLIVSQFGQHAVLAVSKGTGASYDRDYHGLLRFGVVKCHVPLSTLIVVSYSF